jgi:hypothetical protein
MFRSSLRSGLEITRGCGLYLSLRIQASAFRQLPPFSPEGAIICLLLILLTSPVSPSGACIFYQLPAWCKAGSKTIT